MWSCKYWGWGSWSILSVLGRGMVRGARLALSSINDDCGLRQQDMLVLYCYGDIVMGLVAFAFFYDA